MLREHRKAVASAPALRLASSAGSQGRRTLGFLVGQATAGLPAASRDTTDAPETANNFDGMIGTSRQMRQVYERIQTIGPTSSPVLISGETGTGKELVARSLHRRSSRGARPFVPVNACAIVDTLFEAQLFGHEAGAFTDARSSKVGFFEAASGGTLFLDEIAELPMTLQVKLLRAVEVGEVIPVGGTTPMPVDVRLIVATNRDLLTAVSDQTFRADLYYRLAAVSIVLPPLRERQGDLDLLIDDFLARVAFELGTQGDISEPARRQLCAYDWPGNVREVANVLREALVSAKGAAIGLTDLPPVVRGHSAGRCAPIRPLAPGVTLAQACRGFERRCIMQAVEESRGNMSAAAVRLGIDRKTLRTKLRR